MNNINIKTNSNTYDVIFYDNFLEMINEKSLIITDENIFNLYREILNGRKVYILEAGESSKTMESIITILGYFAKNNLSKSDQIIALGGGVVGDIVGFAASIYMRGISYIQIPTTLLSMIDSSVGGKTAVNFLGEKNLIGSIYPPSMVIINSNFLSTLPKEEYDNGLGEMIKYALLDKELYQLMSSDDNLNIDELIYHCINIKKEHVEKDEFDNGIRMNLNLGHTYGHIIESKYGIKHGIAVLYGIKIVIEKYSSDFVLNKFNRITEKMGIQLKENFDNEELEKMISRDKKVRSGFLNIIIPKEVGDISVLKIPVEGSDDI
ncbi:MAG: 3-dehydroquinate synthase [Clostridiales bacterium]|nr:3-dehydroquinate synthase [Clostridiales bacterium]